MILAVAAALHLSAHAKPLKVNEEISAKVEFVRGQAEMTDSLLARFEQLAGLAKLPLVNEFGKQGYRFAFDVAAMDSDLTKGILLSPRRVSGEAAGQLYKDGDAIYAAVALEKKPVSLLFIGFTPAEVQDLLGRYREVYAVNASTKRVPASEVANSETDQPSAFKKVVGMDASKFAYGMASSFGHCALGVVQGFNAIAIDPAVKFGKSMYNLYNYPRWWMSASKQQMIDFWRSLKEFDKTASTIWSDWNTKTPQQKSQLYCSFYGSGGATYMLAKGAAALGSKLPTAAEVIAGAKENATQKAIAAGLKNAPEPKYLGYDASNIIEPNASYIGKSWHVFPDKGSAAYPYLAERPSLEALKKLAQNPPPFPENIDALSHFGERISAQVLRSYPNGAVAKVERALGSPELEFGGRKLLAIPGEGGTAPRLMTAADLKPALPTRVNPMRDIRTFVDDGKFQSINTPGLEYQGNGTIGYKANAPVLQHRPVRIVIGDKMVEGEYLSAAGPGVPRGADPTRLTGNWGVQGHFVKVGDQTVLVPNEGAEIFVRTN